MKKIVTYTIIILTSILFQMMTIFPWWCFLVPVFFLGIILPLEKWKVNSFLSGFVAGFLTWMLSTLYFEFYFDGNITQAISKMFFIPVYILYSIIGCIGGILTGLAFYAGFLLKRGKEALRLETSENLQQ